MQRRTGLEEDDNNERNEMNIERRLTPSHEIPLEATRETKIPKGTTTAPNVDEETNATTSKPKATIGNVDVDNINDHYNDEQNVVATEMIQKMKQDNTTQGRILEYDEEYNAETLDGDDDDNSNTSNASTSDYPGAFAVNGQQRNDNITIDNGTVQYSMGGAPQAVTQTSREGENNHKGIEDVDPIPLVAEPVPDTVHGIAIELNSVQENNNSPRWKRIVVILSVSVFVLIVVAAASITFGAKSNKNDNRKSDPSPTDLPTFGPSIVPSVAPTTSVQQQIMSTLLEYFPGLPESNDQQQALNWIFADPTSSVVLMEEGMTRSNKERTVLERFVLATVYFATNGLGWSNKAHWLSELSVCVWYGVRCQQGDTTTEHGEVVRLVLSQNNLIGSIPTGVGLMTSMTRLFFYNNALTGSIPTEIGMMTSMTDLSLHENALTGSIPTEIRMMTSMTFFFLYYNNLIGSIPTELGSLTRLADLFIFENNLTGSIPTEIGRMTSMTSLLLSDNNLTGSIPTELGSLTRLTWLIISDNPNLTGTIPSEVVAILPNLNSCYMGDTNLIDIPEKCQWVYID